MRLSLLMNKIRWRYGNYWASYAWRRFIIWSVLEVLALLLLLFGAYIVVAWNDQRIESRAREQAAVDEANRYQQVLLACLNGKPTGLFSVDAKGNQIHVACDRAWDLNAGKES